MTEALQAERAGRGPRLHYSLVVLALIVAAVFVALGLGRFGYSMILPAMQEGLRLTHTQTGELQSWNLLGYLLTVVFAGLLAARFGPRVVIATALLLTSAALALTGWWPTFQGARLGRFLAGVGGAGANVPAMALVSAWFGPRRRGLATGVGVGGSSLGLMVSGPLVPALLARGGPEGWRLCWYVLGALALGVFVLCALFLRNRPEELGRSPLGGGVSAEGGSGRPDPAAALDWAKVYRAPVLWHLAAIYFAFGFSYIIYSTFFIRHLVKEGAFSQREAGLLWMAVGMVSVLSGFVWGAVSDRWGRRRALVGVLGLQGLSFLALGLGAAPWLIHLSAGLFALTAWSVPALMAALAGDLWGARLAPAALGLATIVFGLGQALGPWVAGRMADASQSFRPAFLLAGVVAWLGGGGARLLRLTRPGA